MDADDDFWIGMLPAVKIIFPIAGGLESLVRNVKNISWLKFSTPQAYLASHEPFDKISWGMDTADGSFDGMASWTEKWENYKLWTKIENARALERAGYQLIAEIQNNKHFKSQSSHGDVASSVSKVIVKAEQLLNEAFNKRLRLLSTTHFGLSSPVVNKSRLAIAERIADEMKEAAAAGVKLLWSTLGKEKDEYFQKNTNKTASEVFLNTDFRTP